MTLIKILENVDNNTTKSLKTKFRQKHSFGGSVSAIKTHFDL